MQSTDFDLTEIINGEEIMGPSPFFRHQDILSNLQFHIRRYIKDKDKLIASPMDIIFEEGINRLQPDLIFIRKENLSIAQDWIRGVPDMVCEVVSSGSVIKDTITKMEIYEKYKVPEYWIVWPEFAAIEVLVIEGYRYRLFSSAEGQGTVKSKIIDGLQIDINSIFEL
ncbi:MAG: Uma2 family endonuclease [Candidatus Magnetoovum sp. WYHC-5]|nr:Uma2 family endonuclease [Candidatus Magnetoovum sp. WYHC-5]